MLKKIILDKKTTLLRLLMVVILSMVTGLFALQVGAQSDDITITVDAEIALNDINPYVMSVNHSPDGTSLDVVDEVNALELNFVRFPHGNWGDLNDLTDFHIDLYMAQIRNWGATPSINVRFLNSTPEAAANTVRYTNIENDYDVRYWYIGNEPTLYDDYTVERYNEEWREFALAMLEVDPDIILIGPELHQFPDTTDTSNHNYEYKDVWLREFLIANGDLIDIVAVHRYPFPSSVGGPATTLQQMRENVPNWAVLVQNMREIIDETIGEDMPIGITEVNSHYSNSGGGIATPDSYYNAIWYSGVLTTLIHEEVDIVSYFQLYSVGGNGQFGLLDRYDPRPTYYSYLLFGELGNTRLQSASSDEYVTAIATRDEAGRHTMIVTNLYDESDISVTLALNGFDDLSVSDIRLLSPELEAESVAVDDYLVDGTLSMPAQSVMLLVFE
ncbi:MAG: hypothetical protein Phog2KO_30100 [Phototrophicaceae bacterium]